uniref:Secreted protein n=1 Tax=Panagrellus redivivus TaxID=6233 RepID=A0A7E4VNV2_PANRE
MSPSLYIPSATGTKPHQWPDVIATNTCFGATGITCPVQSRISKWAPNPCIDECNIGGDNVQTEHDASANLRGYVATKHCARLNGPNAKVKLSGAVDEWYCKEVAEWCCEN